jgi:hypothetical protein
MESADAALKRMLPELVVSKQKHRQAEAISLVRNNRQGGRQTLAFSSATVCHVQTAGKKASQRAASF